jgi:ketosteroid isomerase-like protein
MEPTEACAVVAAFHDAWNAHDLAAALALCTEDVVFESTDPAPDGVRYAGREAVGLAWQPVFANTSGRFDLEERFAAGDRVVQRWRYDWGTGHVRGVDVISLRGDRIAVKLSYVKG